MKVAKATDLKLDLKQRNKMVKKSHTKMNSKKKKPSPYMITGFLGRKSKPQRWQSQMMLKLRKGLSIGLASFHKLIMNFMLV